MYLSIGVRAVLNVEALNMVESAGNVTRHRTVPLVVAKGPGRYVVRWVPAISGEALAHRYQVELVKVAKTHQGCRDRLDYWSEQGEFLKHFDLGFYEQIKGRVPLKQWEVDLINKWSNLKGNNQNKLNLAQMADFEKHIVENSVVEDVCGFLLTQGPVKRTSRVAFSFAVPTVDSVEAGAAQVDAQMQVRHAPMASALWGSVSSKSGADPQMPYYVQVASAVYGFTIGLDLAGVGVLSYGGGVVNDEACPPESRRCLAVRALESVLDLDFGAKRSRYAPHGVVEVAVAVLASKYITVSPPTMKFDEFIRGTFERASKLGAEKVIVWTRDEGVKNVVASIGGNITSSNKVEYVVSNAAVDFVKKLGEFVGCR